MSLWPLFDLRVRTTRLELRFPNDDDLMTMAALAAEGIHDPDEMPFVEPWTRTPSPALERGLLQQWWLGRGALGPTGWGIPFLVSDHGDPVGVQTIYTRGGWPATRAVSTVSWLVQRAQHKGIGKEMRAAVLHFAFAGVDVQEAHTGSVEDNHAALHVTRSLDYEYIGATEHERDGQRIRALEFSLTKERWSRRRRGDISIENLEECRPLLG